MIAVAVENQGPGKEVPPGATLDTGIGFFSKVVNHCEKEFLPQRKDVSLAPKTVSLKTNAA